MTTKSILDTLDKVNTNLGECIYAASLLPWFDSDDGREIYRNLVVASNQIKWARQEYAVRLALEAENSMGDEEQLDILRDIVLAEDDFTKSTGMKSNDALSKAINRARLWLDMAKGK